MRKRSTPIKGIAALGGMVILVGVLGMPLRSDSFSSFGTTPSDSEPGLVPTTCSTPRFTGQSQFLTRPKGTAKYLFDGICTSPQRPSLQISYQLEASWSPSETDPNKPNASESITMTGYEPFIPVRRPGDRIFMYWTSRCKHDPWLQPDKASCRFIGTYIPDDLRMAVPELQTLNFPKTENMIPPADRQRLHTQYLRLNSPVAGTKRIPGVNAQTDDMFTIKNPQWNASVQQGQLFLKADPPKIGATPVTELEFHWLDAPPNHPAIVNRFAVDTPQLLQGFLVDPRVTRANIGRYEVRARSSGKAVPGPWSFPVMFRLFVTQQTQSQKQISSIQQTAPLPSSSVTQPSAVPQTTPLPPPSVMQAPAPSSAPAQMNQSPFMIRPRGVEGQESAEPPRPTERKP